MKVKADLSRLETEMWMIAPDHFEREYQAFVATQCEQILLAALEDAQ